MPDDLVVRRETHIPAPPAAVFALPTDPEKILRWMGTEAELEPHPGGLYLVNVTGARFARDMFDREAGLEKASGTDRQRAKWKLASERKGRAPINPRLSALPTWIGA